MADGTVRCIDSEIPFAIPDSWAWARFGGIAFNRDSERIPLSVSQRNGLEKKYDYYGASGIIDKVDRYLFDKPLLLIGEDGANLINRSTPIAFIARGKYWVNNHAHVLDFISPILMEYVGNYVNGISLVDYVTGTAQPKMNQEKMNSILVPIPSLTEQSRINDRIANLLPIISKYDNQKDALEKLNNSLNQEIKKSILQEAIQGRLVPQIESEGTAEELLEEIEAEKKRLVKEGKLKKSALTASRIFRGDDNRYYEQIASQTEEIEVIINLPSSWSVCRLRDLCQLTDGEKSSGSYPCLDVKYLRGKSPGTPLTKGKLVHYGDNIILVDGENSGEVFTVPCDGYMGSTFKQLWISKQVDKDFVLLIILFYKSMLRNSKKGAAIPHLNKELFYNIIVGLPPFQEQQRIVAECNLLFDTLK